MSYFHALLSGPPSFDNAANTTAAGKQIWAFIGDSFIAGQPAGGGTDTAGAPYFPSEYFNTSTLLITPLTGDLPTANQGSMCPKFCTDYYRATGLNAVIVNTAIGGSDFYPNGDNNNWYTTGDNYGVFQTRTNQARAALGVSKIRGIIIHLGINDARSVVSNANIQLGVTSLFSRLATDFPGVPVYVINIGFDENKVATQKILDVRAMIEAEAVLNPNFVKIAMRLQDFPESNSPFWYMSDEVDVHPSMYGLDLMAAMVVKKSVANGWMRNSPISYSYSAPAQTLFSTIGTVGDGEKRVISDYYERNLANGNWAVLDDFWCPSLANTTARRKSWTSARVNTGGTIGTYCISTDGTSANRIMSGFTPSIHGVNYTQNAAHVGAFVLRDILKDTTTLHAAFGITGTTTTRQLRLTYNNGTANGNYSINNTGVSTVSGYNLKGNTMHVVRRTASNVLNYSRNATTNSDGTVSNGVPAGQELPFGDWNQNGGFSTPYAAVWGLMRVGGSGPQTTIWYKADRELIVDLVTLQYPL